MHFIDVGGAMADRQRTLLIVDFFVEQLVIGRKVVG